MKILWIRFLSQCVKTLNFTSCSLYEIFYFYFCGSFYSTSIGFFEEFFMQFSSLLRMFYGLYLGKICYVIMNHFTLTRFVNYRDHSIVFVNALRKFWERLNRKEPKGTKKIIRHTKRENDFERNNFSKSFLKSSARKLSSNTSRNHFHPTIYEHSAIKS